MNELINNVNELPIENVAELAVQYAGMVTFNIKSMLEGMENQATLKFESSAESSDSVSRKYMDISHYQDGKWANVGKIILGYKDTSHEADTELQLTSVQIVNKNMRSFAIPEVFQVQKILINPNEGDSYDIAKDVVNLKKLNSIFDLFTLEHEAGHANLSQEKDYLQKYHRAAVKEKLFRDFDKNKDKLTKDQLRERFYDMIMDNEVNISFDPSEITFTQEDYELIVEEEKLCSIAAYKEVMKILDHLDLDLRSRQVVETMVKEYAAAALASYLSALKTYLNRNLKDLWSEHYASVTSE